MTSARRTPLELAIDAERLHQYRDAPPWVLVGDPDAVQRALARHARVVLGIDALAAASPPQLREHGQWWPLLPLAECGEVLTLRGMVDDDELGPVRELDVTVLHGPPPWDPQPTEPYALSLFEAAAWALHLIERVTGACTDVKDEAGRGDGSTWLATCRAGEGAGDAVGRLRVLPASAVPGPSFTATVWFAHGQVLVRDPFAPGRVAVWDARRTELRSGNGRRVGMRAGNDAWPAAPLRRALRWATGDDSAHADLVNLQSEAADLVERLTVHGLDHRTEELHG